MSDTSDRPARPDDDDPAIHPLIRERWSPRAMTGESLAPEEFMPLFEAARRAPSSFNRQPWRFVYARRQTPEWDAFFDLLVDFNQSWAANAALLVVIVSRRITDDGQPLRTHSFDSGAAAQNLALEGRHRGLVVHCMEGFDYQRAAELLELPDGYGVEAMIAIGRHGAADRLPRRLRARERPSDRRPLAEIVFEGRLPRPS